MQTGRGVSKATAPDWTRLPWARCGLQDFSCLEVFTLLCSAQSRAAPNPLQAHRSFMSSSERRAAPLQLPEDIYCSAGRADLTSPVPQVQHCCPSCSAKPSAAFSVNSADNGALRAASHQTRAQSSFWWLFQPTRETTNNYFQLSCSYSCRSQSETVPFLVQTWQWNLKGTNASF